MSALETYFQLLDNEREHDDIGPMIHLEVLLPWKHDDTLWGQPYVQRWPHGRIHIWAVLIGDAFNRPVFLLPETMWPDRVESCEADWRNPYGLRVELDGYVYAYAYGGAS